MSYNVKYATEAQPNSWGERKGMIRDLIQRESPDLIGTQECLYVQVCDILEMMPEYDWIGLGREGGSKGEYSAIFFKKERFRVLEYNHFWLSDTPNVIGSTTWGHITTRMVTWARLVDLQTNQQFYHVNTHFDHVSSIARVKSAQLIIQKLAKFDSNLPIILTGDFNVDMNTEPYGILLNKGSFLDAWNMTNHKVNETLGTFNDFQDPQGGIERIDWILVKGNVKVESARIIADCPNGRFPSDHFPIITNLHLESIY